MEIFGAKQMLMNRGANQPVFERIVEIVNEFKCYFLDPGKTVSELPSPGNVVSGISTLEERSLGAVQEAGWAAVANIIEYNADTHRELTLLESSGNDAASSGALAATGQP